MGQRPLDGRQVPGSSPRPRYAKVRLGQKLAIQRNAFGEVVAEYTSPVNGLVGGLCSDATSEPGNPLFFILTDVAPPPGSAPYAE
jgi:uncharacterized protein